MKFYESAGPGDVIQYKLEFQSTLEDAALLRAEATVNNELKAKGLLTFGLLNIKSQEIADQRKGIFKIWTRDLDGKHPLK